MSTLQVTTIESPDEYTPLVIKTGNSAGPTLLMSSSNNKIYLNGELDGLSFPEVNIAVEYAYTSANAASAQAIGIANGAVITAIEISKSAANVAYEAADSANNSAATAIAALIAANTAYNAANSANDTANTKASTGKAIAMAIVFG